MEFNVAHDLSKTASVPSRDCTPVWRRMLARNQNESHRVASTLELLFDLVFVVAISAAAGQLHHALANGHAVHGLVSYMMVFVAIWWVWMNFSWFASAFDNDDVLYRIAVFIQMAGALVIAAGAESAFEGHWMPMVIGYTIICKKLTRCLQYFRRKYCNEHAQTNPPHAIRPRGNMAFIPNPTMESDALGRTLPSESPDHLFGTQKSPLATICAE